MILFKVAENIASTRRLKLPPSMGFGTPDFSRSREHSFNKKIEILKILKCREIGYMCSREHSFNKKIEIQHDRELKFQLFQVAENIASTRRLKYSLIKIFDDDHRYVAENIASTRRLKSSFGSKLESSSIM